MTAIAFENFDPNVRAQDDLFRHATGKWLASSEIPADKSSTGVVVELLDQAEANVRAIVEELKVDDSDPEQAKLATLYACFMDDERIEKLGSEPLAPILDRIAAITGPGELAQHLGWSLRHGFSSLVSLFEDADPGDPGNCVMFAAQGGLGLPDEEYYRDEEHAEIREAYRAHLERVFSLLDPATASQQADLVFSLEHQIASHHWDQIRSREIRETYNPMSWNQLLQAAPGMDWDAFRDAAGIPSEKLSLVVCCQPSFLTAAGQLVASEPIETWRAWATWKAVARLSEYLSSDFVTAAFDFYGRVLAGTCEQRPRWKRGISLLEGAMGEAIGKRYVERHFPPNAKDAMEELVANLLAAYRESIAELDWLGEETKREAQEKLAKFRPKIGYPERWRDYSALPIFTDDLVGNYLAISSFELDYTIERVGLPVNQHEWHMYPQTVNAYYDALRNEIVFPAAILQPPFFNVEADDPVNYGAIGAAIGHEIGHGFDDVGSTCDGDGRLRNWWTDEDRATFEELTAQLVSQYERLSPTGADGRTVNGKLTLGENIGDLGGLEIAYRAWLLSGGDPAGEHIDDLSPAQRFFLGWAGAWRAKLRPETVKRYLVIDPHSPDEFRCNQTVRNLTAFHEAFDTCPEDAMWLAPEERVRIW